MLTQFFIGVDGGASKCTVRVEDTDGHLIGKAITGPANIRISVSQTWQSIYQALSQILDPQGIKLNHSDYHFHAGFGLAGCEFEKNYREFLACPHPFQTLKVTSDAHIACLGAHDGSDGAIIIAGTGVVGWQIQNTILTRVSGYGFPHDDEGGGAWIGLQALSSTLKTLDGRALRTPFSEAIFSYFQHNLTDLLEWANSATSTDFAKLAPIVIALDEKNNEIANQLLRAAAKKIDDVFSALKEKQKDNKNLNCVLVGGIAPFLQKYVSDDLRAHLVSPISSPDEGAVKWVRALAVI